MPEKIVDSKPGDTVLTPVRLLYDTWDADEKRVPAGAVVELPLEAAKQLLNDGKAERADPLPGEKTA